MMYASGPITYSETLHATIHLRILCLRASSSSPSKGLADNDGPL